MKILIKVTKEILERSKMCGETVDQLTSTNCAIALAVREIWPKASVGCAIHPFGGMHPEIHLPATAYNFISRFDSTPPKDRPGLPEFSFEIDVPQEVIEKIGINEVYKILSESKTLELVQP